MKHGKHATSLHCLCMRPRQSWWADCTQSMLNKSLQTTLHAITTLLCADPEPGFAGQSTHVAVHAASSPMASEGATTGGLSVCLISSTCTGTSTGIVGASGIGSSSASASATASGAVSASVCGTPSVISAAALARSGSPSAVSSASAVIVKQSCTSHCTLCMCKGMVMTHVLTVLGTRVANVIVAMLSRSPTACRCS